MPPGGSGAAGIRVPSPGAALGSLGRTSAAGELLPLLTRLMEEEDGGGGGGVLFVFPAVWLYQLACVIEGKANATKGAEPLSPCPLERKSGSGAAAEQQRSVSRCRGTTQRGEKGGIRGWGRVPLPLSAGLGAPPPAGRPQLQQGVGVPAPRPRCLRALPHAELLSPRRVSTVARRGPPEHPCPQGHPRTARAGPGESAPAWGSPPDRRERGGSAVHGTNNCTRIIR